MTFTNSLFVLTSVSVHFELINGIILSAVCGSGRVMLGQSLITGTYSWWWFSFILLNFGYPYALDKTVWNWYSIRDSQHPLTSSRGSSDLEDSSKLDNSFSSINLQFEVLGENTLYRWENCYPVLTSLPSPACRGSCGLVVTVNIIWVCVGSTLSPKLVCAGKSRRPIRSLGQSGGFPGRAGSLIMVRHKA